MPEFQELCINALIQWILYNTFQKAGIDKEWNMKRRIYSVLVENRSGVLGKVAGLFARRCFNIDSLAVSSGKGTRKSGKSNTKQRKNE